MSGPEAEVRLWLTYARDDLRSAEALLDNPGSPRRHACWHAQQAGEKAIKAALIYATNNYQRIHDLDTLRNALPAGWSLKESHPKLRSLTQWATEARYPGPWPDASREEADECVRLANEVLSAVLNDLARRGFEISR